MAVRLDNFTGGADYYSGTVSVVPGSSGAGTSMCMGMLNIFNEDVSGFSLSLDEPTAGANLFHRPRAGGDWRTTYQPGVNNTTTAGSLWSTGAAFQWNGVSVLDEDQHAPWWDTTLHTLSAGTVTAHDENYDTFTVGADSAGGNKIGMDVAEVFILDRVITAADMALLADGFSPYFFLGNGLVEYWPFYTTGTQVGWVQGWTLTENGAPIEAPHPSIIMPSSQEIFMPSAVVATASTPSLTLLGVG